MNLPRLTEAMVQKAEASGQAAGWHALCSKGYLPAEIAVFSRGPKWANDIRQRVREHAERHELPIPASCARSREPREMRPVLDWKDAFRSTVMRTGMNLALTQPMLECLCATAGGVMWDRFGTSSLARPDNWIATEHSLTKRGLIRRKTEKQIRDPGRPFGSSVCELTEAGRHVVELLRVTGMFVEADRAIEEKHGGTR